MGEHTPGPWEVADFGDNYYGQRYGEVAFLLAKEGASFEATEANARLIAAAPDLLAALCDFVAAFDRDAHFFGTEYEAARTAIAKARGEARTQDNGSL